MHDSLVENNVLAIDFRQFAQSKKYYFEADIVQVCVEQRDQICRIMLE